jgi:transketolase
MGIAEQNMVGVAAGLATLGYIPWLSSFGVFLTHRAADPARLLVAQTHANVKIGAAYTGLLTGRTGKTHQDVEDLAIMRAMPGMTVLAPGDATECIAMVRWASAMSGPVYLRLARDAGPDLVDPDYEFVPGRVLVVRAGTDVLIVSTGMQTARCLAAAALLEADGISAGVLHVPSLKPVDAAAIAAAAGRVPLVVSVEEHSVFGGLGGLVAEIVGALAPRRVARIGIEDTWGESASNAFLLDRHGLSPERVAERVAREVHRPGAPADASMGAAE